MDQQRELRADGKLIVSGTGLTTAGAGGDHTRELYFGVPLFASRPDITVSIYSDDNSGVLGLPDVDQLPGESLPHNVANNGVRLVPWAIQYLAEQGPGGDWIAVSAATIDGSPTNGRFFCSYVIVGEPKDSE